jgi:hypothetical protein
MSPFPSDLPFFSLLQYAPRGTSKTSRQSCKVVHAIKTNANWKVQEQTVNIIAYTAKRASEVVASADNTLSRCLGPNVLLVPMPRSSLQRPDALWPSLVICEALIAEGLGTEIDPCLRRTVPVEKSATAAPGQRPDPVDHYNSVVVERKSLLVPGQITIVDDVITRGSSFVGVFPRIEDAFPGVPISCFAVVRTISEVTVQTPCMRGEPVTGSEGSGYPRRPRSITSAR